MARLTLENSSSRRLVGRAGVLFLNLSARVNRWLRHLDWSAHDGRVYHFAIFPPNSHDFALWARLGMLGGRGDLMQFRRPLFGDRSLRHRGFNWHAFTACLRLSKSQRTQGQRCREKSENGEIFHRYS